MCAVLKIKKFKEWGQKPLPGQTLSAISTGFQYSF
jgi:hypothetical protein